MLFPQTFASHRAPNSEMTDRNASQSTKTKRRFPGEAEYQITAAIDMA
jgi:hypothetical protein